MPGIPFNIGINAGIGLGSSGSSPWTQQYASKMIYRSSLLDFVNNKLTDQTGHPLNAPLLVKSYCLSGNGTDNIINTDYSPVENSEFELLFRYRSTPASVLNGFYNASGNAFFGITVGGKWWGGFGNKSITSATNADTNWHVLKLNKIALYIDDNVVCSFAGYAFTPNAANIFYLFRCEGIGSYNPIDLVYFKIRTNGTLVREYYAVHGSGIKLYDYTKTTNVIIDGTAGFWGTQNFYHYNLQYGFDVWQKDSDGSYVFCPVIGAGLTNTDSARFTGYTWISRITQDGSQFLECETKLNFPLTDEIKTSETIPYLLNAGKTAAVDIGYNDIAQINYDYFNFRTKKDLVICTEAIPIKNFL